MDFRDVLSIIMRVFFGLCCIGFILGLFLHEKNKVFKFIFEGTVVLAVWYGIGQMFMYAIFGN